MMGKAEECREGQRLRNRRNLTWNRRPGGNRRLGIVAQFLGHLESSIKRVHLDFRHDTLTYHINSIHRCTTSKIKNRRQSILGARIRLDSFLGDFNWTSILSSCLIISAHEQ